MTITTHDIVVVGAGPAGLAAAVAFRQAGHDAICVGPAPLSGAPDRRTTALLQGSVAFLGKTGIWNRLAVQAAPLRTLRLIDRTGRLFRAPDMLFEAWEIGEDAFGYNVPNTILLGALIDALGEGFVPTTAVRRIERGSFSARLTLADGSQLDARLVVGADGRHSLCRETAGIGVRNWSYDQIATVCNFHHARPHQDACTEFHYTGGPFTVVPLRGNESSLVWIERTEEGKALAALTDAEFALRLADRLGGLFGDVTGVGPRGAFPLSGLIARAMTADRIALVGEAAHVMPPIGAQGLNLGFRDIADLIVCLSGEDDPGSAQALAAYERARRGDVLTRTLAADLLNRTLISSMPLLQLARGGGLLALSLPGPLRRAAMRQGMAAG